MKLSGGPVWIISQGKCQTLFTQLTHGGWPAQVHLQGIVGKFPLPKKCILLLYLLSGQRVSFFLPTDTPVLVSVTHPFPLCTEYSFTSQALGLYITVIYKFAYIEYIF